MSYCKDCYGRVYWGVLTEEDGSNPRNVPFDDSNLTEWHWESCKANVFVTDVFGHTYRVTRCKDCRQKIYWETTARGRKRPMDCSPTDDSLQDFTADGTCHFETCTGRATGDNWRQQDQDRQRREGYDRTRRQRREQAANGTVGRPVYQQIECEPWLKDLQLSWPSTPEEIKSAYRRLALQTHPDMGGTDAAFITVKRAYDHLRILVPS